jgi:hypothetical protein
MVEDEPSVHERVVRAAEQSAILRERSKELLTEADATLRRLSSSAPMNRVQDLLTEVRGLRAALESRAVIEQAKGIITARTGMPPEMAFEVLVRQSQHENRKVRDIAEMLVSSATRPAKGSGDRVEDEDRALDDPPVGDER